MSALHVVSVQGYAGLQDEGRAGRAHEGIPPLYGITREILSAVLTQA